MRPTINPKCPEPFQKLITTVWDKDPSVRPTAVKLIQILRELENSSYIPNKYSWDSALAIGPKSEAHYEKYNLSLKSNSNTFSNEQLRLSNMEIKERKKNTVSNTITISNQSPSQWLCYSVKDLKNLSVVKENN